jgi:hypothetical protein
MPLWRPAYQVDRAIGLAARRRAKARCRCVEFGQTLGFAELASILCKTSGLGDVLSAAPAPLAGRVCERWSGTASIRR